MLMDKVLPRSAEDLADALASASAANQTIRIGGAFSKDGMAGPLAPAGTVISTTEMNRILQYEPRLKNVIVQHVRDDEVLVLKFQITAQLASKTAKGAVRLETQLRAGGQISVR